MPMFENWRKMDLYIDIFYCKQIWNSYSWTHTTALDSPGRCAHTKRTRTTHMRAWTNFLKHLMSRPILLWADSERSACICPIFTFYLNIKKLGKFANRWAHSWGDRMSISEWQQPQHSFNDATLSTIDEWCWLSISASWRASNRKS